MAMSIAFQDCYDEGYNNGFDNGFDNGVINGKKEMILHLLKDNISIDSIKLAARIDDKQLEEFIREAKEEEK